MNSVMNVKAVLCRAILVLALILFCFAPAMAAAKKERQFVRPDALVEVAPAEEKDEVKAVPTAEQNPRSILKSGFFAGIRDGKVSLIDMKSYRKRAYRLKEDYLLFYGEEEIELYNIPPSSIVKLIMIEGQVWEIILLQRAS